MFHLPKAHKYKSKKRSREACGGEGGGDRQIAKDTTEPQGPSLVSVQKALISERTAAVLHVTLGFALANSQVPMEAARRFVKTRWTPIILAQRINAP